MYLKEDGEAEATRSLPLNPELYKLDESTLNDEEEKCQHREISSNSRLHCQYDETRDIEHAWPPHIEVDPESGDPSIAIFVLDQARRSYYNKANPSKASYVRRHIIRRGERQITDRRISDARSERCSMGMAVYGRNADMGDTGVENGQRRSIQPSENKYSRRSHHIEHRYHYLRQEVRREQLKITTIPGEENPADILTKLLPAGSWKE